MCQCQVDSDPACYEVHMYSFQVENMKLCILTKQTLWLKIENMKNHAFKIIC